MNDDRLHDETELASAFRSVRQTYNGAHEAPNLTLQRALFRTRTRERKQRFARWVLVPIAAALVASTAWAGVTGRRTPAVSSVLDALHAALFAGAHRRHFVERDPHRALAAWDRYLAAAPNGRFAPEARYNRALTLVRMGRNVEAKRELELFANGMYGPYRQDEWDPTGHACSTASSSHRPLVPIGRSSCAGRSTWTAGRAFAAARRSASAPS